MAKIVQLILAALVAGLIARLVHNRNQPPPDAPSWPAWTETTDAAAPRANVDQEAKSWIEPDAAGDCASSHPVKVKLSSGIFHILGQRNYERTNADRCYLSADTASADGFRASKV
ncbi:MAG: hypothetical protein GXP35_13870 [Actinobacteria bacterium]|nr:hypothetical protein [Actinomycetota bacterium]